MSDTRRIETGKGQIAKARFNLAEYRNAVTGYEKKGRLICIFRAARVNKR